MGAINNQTLQDITYVDGNPFTNPSISVLQEVYKLEKYDFDKIVNGKSYLSEIKNLLYGTCLGLFINMSAKFIGSKIDHEIIFDNWEVFAFLTSILFLIIVESCDYCFPSERKKIIKKIKSHFNI